MWGTVASFLKIALVNFRTLLCFLFCVENIFFAPDMFIYVMAFKEHDNRVDIQKTFCAELHCNKSYAITVMLRFTA